MNDLQSDIKAFEVDFGGIRVTLLQNDYDLEEEKKIL